MKVMNSAKIIVRDWANAFMPVVSQGRGKVIVEGYQDMQRSGIHFPPTTEPPSWQPKIKVEPGKPNQVEHSVKNRMVNSEENSLNRAVSGGEEEEEEEFDIKAFYRRVKRLEEKLDEEGDSFFANSKAQAIASECEMNIPRIRSILQKEEVEEEDNYIAHVKKLLQSCERVKKQYQNYQSATSLQWSDNEDDWDWANSSSKSTSKTPTTLREDKSEDLFSSLDFSSSQQSQSQSNIIDFDFFS